jgi:hypothetical protein
MCCFVVHTRQEGRKRKSRWCQRMIQRKWNLSSMFSPQAVALTLTHPCRVAQLEEHKGQEKLVESGSWKLQKVLSKRLYRGKNSDGA